MQTGRFKEEAAGVLGRGEGWQGKCPRGRASRTGRVSRMGRAGVLGERVGRVGALEAQDESQSSWHQVGCARRADVE